VQRHPRPLDQTTFVYGADGSFLTAFHGEENRVLVAFREIPRVVRQAVVAIEDRRFYQHAGVDLRALIRAAYVDATSGDVVQGGSTITEQYVKNRYLGSAQTLSRKIKEAILAWQLEHRLTKNQILARYLNTVYFGAGAYGIQAAAKTYFSKPASALDLPEAAMLAGLIAAPSALEPIDHPRRARARRNVVLRVMRDVGAVSAAEASEASSAPLGLRPPASSERYPAPYFVQFVKEWFLSNPRFGTTRSEREELLYQGGLRIYTTLDPSLQSDAERAVRQILLYRRDPHAAMTVLDPRTGAIRAMVGGRDYFSRADPVAQVNLATGGTTGRQAGSAFKPFALIAALESGIPPEHVYPAPPSIRIALPSGCRAPDDPEWDVTNYDGTGSGEMTLEEATIDSVNVVYAQLVGDIGNGDPCAGARKVIEVARRLGVSPPALSRMGIGEPLEPVPASVLGAEQVNTVEMASAYGTLANMGYRVTPNAVSRVLDAHGRTIYDASPSRRLALDPPLAWVTDQILQKVVQSGTGQAANIGRPEIGKTGTAQRWRDAWFVGAIPQLSAAVWVGFPQAEVPMTAPRTRLPHVLGGTWPAQIWHVFMTNATRGAPVLDFPQPAIRYVTINVDMLRDCLPNEFTPPYLIRAVRYLLGTEPTQQCTEPTSYQPLPVPSVIGLPWQEAENVLRAAGFQWTVVTRESQQPAGTVIQQDPAADEQALQASAITIVVATPPPAPSPAPPLPGPTTTPSPESSPPPVVTSPTPTPSPAA
jgi:penicillin-binding protein 1A